MNALPVLMLTQDAALWHGWQRIAGPQWLPARGQRLADLQRWTQQGRSLVVLDAALPQLPAAGDAQWSALLQDARVLVLSNRPSDEEGRQLLAKGACGYGHAQSSAETLSQMLQSMAGGNIWMGRSLLQRLLRDVDARLPEPRNHWAVALSPREQEVARYASLGESNAEIAARMSISERTVRAHLSAVFEKLQVSDRLMLALKVHGIGRQQTA
ncbi:response regulator transcription factor [Comamonas endophytica]|uniref:Response regulator transcription factor n=1 Tax=Comamonas endophytica TaxID=2949090 RepID=A0ABY6GCB3_9BURK|nr:MULTISPECIES: response regulator transcription factor [unclassified Acidovorax]MCD2514014.1 response regulator transcription factor [Acidovorax sp. D4N7]UYG51997.1 response regulator transcription factor [Acidovorax sp. 5MLIR]